MSFKKLEVWKFMSWKRFELTSNIWQISRVDSPLYE